MMELEQNSAEEEEIAIRYAALLSDEMKNARNELSESSKGALAAATITMLTVVVLIAVILTR